MHTNSLLNHRNFSHTIEEEEKKKKKRKNLLKNSKSESKGWTDIRKILCLIRDFSIFGWTYLKWARG